MDGFKSPDEMIKQAFKLAYFILDNKTEAISVVREALSKLEVAAAAQGKRLYYLPTRRALWQRAKHANGRTKVSLSNLHLLQRLIYVESEPFERARERAPHALQDEDLLIHFIKHLIRISIKRNSFYVALGISRLLHNYSTNETMEIYNVVVQDPDRVKDDYYYRSRKSRLLQEIKERFDEFVNVCRGSRGEERFQTLNEAGQFVELVAECLTQFSPWRTTCSIQRRYDPTMDEIPALSSAHQSEEDKVEINRIHAVVHPNCYELLTTSLKLDPPARRLSVPHFNLPNGKNNMSRPNDKPRRPAPPLDGDEVAALKRILSEQSARRKATHATLLSIVVDKMERARLDLQTAGTINFAVNDRDELVEVRALDDREWILLATHLLGGGSNDTAGPAKSEIMLEGGQRLTFKLSPARSEAGEDSQALMSISYHETEWSKAAALFWRRMMRRITGEGSFEQRPSSLPIKLVFSALILILCVGTFALYIFRSTRDPNTVNLASNKQQPSVNQASSDFAAMSTNKSLPDASKPYGTVAGSQSLERDVIGGHVPKKDLRNTKTPAATQLRAATAGSATRTDRVRRTTTPRSASEEAEVASGRLSSETEGNTVGVKNPTDSDATRSVEQNAGPTALGKVRKVFIDVVGDASLCERTARLLAGSLRESQRLTPTDVKDDADAAFKIKISESSLTRVNPSNKVLRDSDPSESLVTVSVRLVNEGGEVIWPARGNGHERTYTGKVKDVTKRIASDLLTDVRKSDTRK
jgi:hypothetical protein